MPIVLGGDHSLAAGTLVGLSRRAAEQGRELFVLWLDAHPDFHTLDTTRSGNLHGVPGRLCDRASRLRGRVSAAGRAGEAGEHLHDGHPQRRSRPSAPRSPAGIVVHDMRAIDEHGVAPLLTAFLRASPRRTACCMSASTSISSIRHRARRRHHRAGRGDLPRGASRHGDAARQRAGRQPRSRRAQPVPRRARPHRHLLVDLVASLMGRRVMDPRPDRWSLTENRELSRCLRTSISCPSSASTA
jgi:hypothetical protein